MPGDRQITTSTRIGTPTPGTTETVTPTDTRHPGTTHAATHPGANPLVPETKAHGVRWVPCALGELLDRLRLGRRQLGATVEDDHHEEQDEGQQEQGEAGVARLSGIGRREGAEDAEVVHRVDDDGHEDPPETRRM